MYHCFCKNLQDNKKNPSDYVFKNAPTDDKKICTEWYTTMSRSSLLVMAIPGVIGTINIGVEIIIGFGSEYISKPRNYQSIVLEAMGGICGIQFINLSILFVLVSMNSENFLNVFSILQGPYQEMNSAWYIEFGTMIVWGMIFEIPMPHGFPILILTSVLLYRWYDRKFKSDKTITR